MKLERRAAMAALVANRDDDLLVVPGLGSTAWDLAAAGDNDRNFYLWGAMGGAAMIGLGLALAQPRRPVVVITGDGEMLMGLGALATIGGKQPNNLTIVVLDNGHYGVTGMQQSHAGAGIDLVAIAKGCRFAQALAVTDIAEAGKVRALLHAGRGPVFVDAKVAAVAAPRVALGRDAVANKARFMEALKHDPE